VAICHLNCAPLSRALARAGEGAKVGA
jgi:hypothetical protein